MRLRRYPGRMARRLVCWCVIMLSAAAFWSAAVKTMDPAADLSDVLTFIGAAFGGELLMLLLKRVFAKETQTTKDEEDSTWNS